MKELSIIFVERANSCKRSFVETLLATPLPQALNVVVAGETLANLPNSATPTGVTPLGNHYFDYGSTLPGRTCTGNFAAVEPNA